MFVFLRNNYNVWCYSLLEEEEIVFRIYKPQVHKS